MGGISLIRQFIKLKFLLIGFSISIVYFVCLLSYSSHLFFCQLYQYPLNPHFTLNTCAIMLCLFCLAFTVTVTLRVSFSFLSLNILAWKKKTYFCLKQVCSVRFIYPNVCITYTRTDIIGNVFERNCRTAFS